MYERITDSRPNRSPIVCAPTRKRPLSAGALHPGICSGTDVVDAAAPETEEVVVSRFTEKMYRNARTVTTGMVTGEPYEPVRHTWGEVHERARRIAGGLAAAGIGPGEAVGAQAAHRPGDPGRGLLDRIRHARGQGLHRLRAVPGCRPSAGGEGHHGPGRRGPAGVRADRPGRGRRGRPGAHAADVGLDRLGQG